MDFKNKNIIITGGSTGIGFAAAKAYINAGAKVWITGRNAENLQVAASKINNTNLKTVVADTSSMEGIALLEASFTESGQALDVLFINAGIAVFTPIELTTEADFDAQFNTNIKGAYFTLQKFIKHLAEGSSVLFTSSTVATASQMNGSVYSATKGAMNKLAHVAANELAAKKIRVNILSPGPTQTEGFDKAVPDDAIKNQFASTTALQRMGSPDEIANAALFLTSEKASFITGSELLVDGGYIGYALK